jgi:mRNA-degrading endonuclease RelE of RelBE toxin-antitoxin system
LAKNLFSVHVHQKVRQKRLIELEKVREIAEQIKGRSVVSERNKNTEATKLSFRRFPPFRQSFEYLVSVNSLRMAYIQRRRIYVRDFVSFPQSAAKQESQKVQYAKHQRDESLVTRHFRIRIGDYRVIFSETGEVMKIEKIGNRGDVYREYR